MELVEFKYVYCPVLSREIRLKRAYQRKPDGSEGPKTLVDCVGAFTCGAGSVWQGKVVRDFSSCPFTSVGFIH
ncbi:MAG: hypothetical protein JRI97_01745 [Deltaproteobacteria bacterium]|nr:hypothetical protein [Deltaproteobacteria bacterium]